MLRRCMITLLEEQLDNMGEENYKYSRNYTDKIVNKYYQRTKNLHLDSEDKLNNLLSDESLLKLAL